MAMVKKFGPKSFTMVHFDAHHDVGASSIGMFTHGGRAQRWAYESGWLNGGDIISIGLRGGYGSPEILSCQREAGVSARLRSVVNPEPTD